MYDFQWHENHGLRTTFSAERIIDILTSFASIDTVLDVGCGDGRWLSACRAKGAKSISGVDGPWTDLNRLLVPEETIVIKDLSQPFDLGRRYDSAFSLEVAEHVPTAVSEVFVDNLIRHSDIIVFGRGHSLSGGLSPCE